MDYKNYIASKLNISGVSEEELKTLLVTPPDTSLGDYALPCFRFAKVLRKAPNVIAEELKNSFSLDDVITNVRAVNGYLNFTVNRQNLTLGVLDKILTDLGYSVNDMERRK